MPRELSTTALAKLAELRGSAASRAVVDHIERLALEGEDVDCVHINAFAVADHVGVPRLDAVRAFLFATRIGLVDLSWDIHCPSCTAMPAFHRHLMELERRAHCTLCDLKWDVSFEEQVEVTFSIHGDVRSVDADALSETRWPEDRVRIMARHRRVGRSLTLAAGIGPNGLGAAEGLMTEGEYEYQLPGEPAGGGRLIIEGPDATEPQRFELDVAADGTIEPREVRLRPGPVELRVRSAYPKPNWGLRVLPVGQRFGNWVSAAYVTSLQDFRDLFASEHLAPDLAFAVKSTTLMFTDIRGSTELYERLGDAGAYALVQLHFRLMTEVIRRREGGIVKTIGDAVMASFVSNKNAVLAAIEIQEAFDIAGIPLEEIEVKIGLHRGPAIAVTSNRALDFFGRSVNIAARVQGESRPGEVLLTDAVLSDPAARDVLRERNLDVHTFDAELKGIAGAVRVGSVRVRRPRS